MFGLATFCMIAGGGGGGLALCGGGAGPPGGGGGGGWLGGLIGGGCDGRLTLEVGGAGGALFLGRPMVAESVLTGGAGTSSTGAGEPRTLKLAARLTPFAPPAVTAGGGGGGFMLGRPPADPGGLDVGGGGGFFRVVCIEGLALGLNEGVDVRLDDDIELPKPLEELLCCVLTGPPPKLLGVLWGPED